MVLNQYEILHGSSIKKRGGYESGRMSLSVLLSVLSSPVLSLSPFLFFNLSAVPILSSVFENKINFSSFLCSYLLFFILFTLLFSSTLLSVFPILFSPNPFFSLFLAITHSILVCFSLSHSICFVSVILQCFRSLCYHLSNLLLNLNNINLIYLILAP